MARRKKKTVEFVDKRDIPVSDEMIEHIASQPAGGSGEGSYITGRIQSMAREIMFYRKREAEQCGLQFGSVAQ